MDQDSVPSPEITTGAGHGTPYAVYLHSTAWVLRKAVAWVTGTGELFDKTVHIPTPGLGEGKVSVSVCIPRNQERTPDAYPLLLVAQGGGFVLGQPSDGEHIDRSLSDKVGVVVISVDYAKSPRYPYPHALLQLYEVMRWALSPSAPSVLGVALDPSRVAIMGNSAGGNLATSLSLLLSFASGPCASFRKGLPADFHQVLQVLLYPSVDLFRDYNERLGSADEAAQAASLPAWAATMMEAAYLPPPIEKTQLFISPSQAEISLLRSLHPPAVIMFTAGRDCLKLEGKRYAERLRESGVNVSVVEYPEAIHGFSHYKEGSKDFRKDDVEDCWARVAGALQARFS